MTIKSFFNESKPQKRQRKKKPIEEDKQEYKKPFCDYSLIDVWYCKKLYDDEIHLLINKDKKTKCGLFFKERLELPGYSTDISDKKKCELCFSENKRKRKRK